MIIATGQSSRHVSAMAEKIGERLSERLGFSGNRRVRMEGLSQGDWVVVDSGDVVVHLFRAEVREFYALEKMWRDPAPAPATSPS